MTISRFDWYDRILQQYPVPYETRTVTTERGPTHVLVSGHRDAQPVVLLHGANDTALTWINQVGQLSAHFRTHAIDLPGFPGKSASRNLNGGPGAVAWLSQTLDALGIDGTPLVGQSLGAWLALKFAARYPKRVSRLALLAPVGIVPIPIGRIARYVLRLVLGSRRRTSLKSAMAAKPINPGAQDYFAKAARYQKWFNAVYPYVIPDASMRRLTMPLLLVVGASDYFSDPTAVISRVRRTVPGAQIAQFADCDHLVLNDQPELTMNALMAFLTENSRLDLID